MTNCYVTCKESVYRETLKPENFIYPKGSRMLSCAFSSPLFLQISELSTPIMVTITTCIQCCLITPIMSLYSRPASMFSSLCHTPVEVVLWTSVLHIFEVPTEGSPLFIPDLNFSASLFPFIRLSRSPVLVSGSLAICRQSRDILNDPESRQCCKSISFAPALFEFNSFEM